MKRFGLVAVPVFLLAGVLQAQQVPNGPLGATSTDAPTAAAAGSLPPQMTPRDRAEMNAEILMARKEFDQAAKAYQSILIDAPHDSKILNSAGIAFQQLGDSPRAQHYYRLAAHYDKTDPNSLNNLGTLEFSQQRYGKAIKYYRQSISRGHPVATVYSNLGYAYCGLKAYPQATAAFNQALAIDPEVFEHKSTVGTVLQQRSSDDPGPLHFMLAKSYAKIGDAARAARYLKMARDEGYKAFRSAQKDPDFAKVIKDPQVQEVLTVQPAYAVEPAKSTAN
jgi:tetratricopeptide (TPR) repeat protein